jgi:hypothetical protein
VVSIDNWWDGLVRDRAEAIIELVMLAIADDYESVEIILKSINEWNDEKGPESWPAKKAIPVSRAEVIKALHELTREGYAEAYELSPWETQPKKTAFRESEIDDLWFYATSKGQRAIEQLYKRDADKL